ncbi:MAG: Uma2 family endonuclease, partial [Pirellulales bacterium]|nr:Uma2 family endonuclease [Pirellulales bacterium]
AASVPEYWIVMPEQRAIEIYTSPTADRYEQVRKHEDADAALSITAFPNVSIVPNELFGKP